MGFFNELIQNKVLMIAIIAWFVAQVIKVILSIIKNKEIDFTRFVGSGGMPSSHSSFSMALTTSIGKIYGWSSPLLLFPFPFL